VAKNKPQDPIFDDSNLERILARVATAQQKRKPGFWHQPFWKQDLTRPMLSLPPLHARTGLLECFKQVSMFFNALFIFFSIKLQRL
jgi:hypothetical protein